MSWAQCHADVAALCQLAVPAWVVAIPQSHTSSTELLPEGGRGISRSSAFIGSILTMSECVIVFWLLAVSDREAAFCRWRAEALWGLQDNLRVTKQGLKAHVSVSHTRMIGTFFFFTVTLTLEISRHFVLGKLAEDCCLHAYSNSSMRQCNGYKYFVDNHSFILFLKHFFRLGCFSQCFSKQLYKRLHKHDGGAEAGMVFKTFGVWER